MHVLIYRSIYSFLYFFSSSLIVVQSSNVPGLTVLQTTHFSGTSCLTTNLTRRLYPISLMPKNSCLCPLANGHKFLSICTIESHRVVGLRYSLHLYRKPPKYKQTNGIRIKRFNVTTKNFYFLASSLFSVEFQPVFYTFLIFLHYFSPSDPLLCTPSKPLPLLLHNHRLL